MSLPAARFVVVGSGWRAAFFLLLAELLPERFTATGVVTRTRGEQVAARWGLPTAPALADLAGLRPDFVLVAVPRDVTPAVVTEAVELGLPVLAETPPAPDEAGLRALWAQVGATGMVQVAEQYPLLPPHAARREVLRRGAVGTVGSVQVSSTHDYHAVALVRHLLGAGFGPVEVTARALQAPLVDPLSRAGWSADRTPREATTTLAVLDFGAEGSGLYDFTDNQWFNPLRRGRLVVRGSSGELVDDSVVRLAEGTGAVTTQLVRRQTGLGGNLEGFDLDLISHEGEVVYRNPYPGARLSDEQIALATLLDATALWSRGEGPEPYPLADACQDHLVALAIHAAVSTGRPVTTSPAPWAD